MLNRIFTTNSKKDTDTSYDLNSIHDYFWNSCYIGHFKQTPLLARLDDVLTDIYNNNIREGYELSSKYPYTKDLRPNVYTYDPAFVNILFENNIPQLLKTATSQSLILSHVQLRIAYPTPNGYMEWHRDTHYYSSDDQVVGNVPPVQKIIYYPNINVKEDTLEILPGSSIEYAKNKKDDLARIKSRQKAIVRFSNSNSSFLLFNTFALHSTLPTKNPKGALRLIYSFACKSQLNNYKAQSALHQLYSDKNREHSTF